MAILPYGGQTTKSGRQQVYDRSNKMIPAFSMQKFKMGHLTRYGMSSVKWLKVLSSLSSLGPNSLKILFPVLMNVASGSLLLVSEQIIKNLQNLRRLDAASYLFECWDVLYTVLTNSKPKLFQLPVNH
uniref:Uncharacterized protein n=1 Tax=Glossina pallidipes TaxID=7398 RepID=A0A1A9ZUV5_GLOPL